MKGTVTKKGNRWYPRVYIGKDENGKWKQKWGKGYETKKEAEKQLRVLLDEVENTYDRKADKSTVAVFMRHWLVSYCEPRLAGPGVKFCVSDFRQSQEWRWKAGRILA